MQLGLEHVLARREALEQPLEGACGLFVATELGQGEGRAAQGGLRLGSAPDAAEGGQRSLGPSGRELGLAEEEAQLVGARIVPVGGEEALDAAHGVVITAQPEGAPREPVGGVALVFLGARLEHRQVALLGRLERAAAEVGLAQEEGRGLLQVVAPQLEHALERPDRLGRPPEVELALSEPEGDLGLELEPAARGEPRELGARLLDAVELEQRRGQAVARQRGLRVVGEALEEARGFLHGDVVQAALAKPRDQLVLLVGLVGERRGGHRGPRDETGRRGGRGGGDPGREDQGGEGQGGGAKRAHAGSRGWALHPKQASGHQAARGRSTTVVIEAPSSS